MNEASNITINWDGLEEYTNDVYYPLYENYDRFLVLYGGAGTGKSHFAAQDVIYTCVNEAGQRVLVVRNIAATHLGTTFTALCDVIEAWGFNGLCTITKHPMQILFHNGSRILFTGMDDEKKQKSQNASLIWMEEADEMELSAFRQMDLRLRYELEVWDERQRKYVPGKQQMILTFNPTSIESWVKAEFFDRQQEAPTTVIKTTPFDNRFLPKSYFDKIAALKEVDPYYYSVYYLGNWGVVGGAFFDAEKVQNRLQFIRDQQKEKIGLPVKGEFVYEFISENKINNETIKYSESNAGFVKIYLEPEPGKPYVLAGDTSGTGEDYWTAQVIDNVTGDQVATMQIQHVDDDVYAEQLYCIAKHYNDALISIETNFTTYPIKRLEQLGYDNQFLRETEDSISHRLQKRYGVKTTTKTRPLMLAELVKVVRDNITCINDTDTLSEMLTFVRNEKGKPEAQKGKHDDLVMALAIAYYSRAQQENVVDLKVEEKKTEIQKHKEKMMKKVNSRHNKFARY